MKILIIHGPNLNRLGKRETDVYGIETLDELNKKLVTVGSQWGLAIECIQSNIEGELINHIHQSDEVFDAILFNPGAYTHYSYALRDAISSISVPVIEVHLTNISSRESFREKSVISPVCMGQISGFGLTSYELGLFAIKRFLAT